MDHGEARQSIQDSQQWTTEAGHTWTILSYSRKSYRYDYYYFSQVKIDTFILSY